MGSLKQAERGLNNSPWSKVRGGSWGSGSGSLRWQRWLCLVCPAYRHYYPLPTFQTRLIGGFWHRLHADQFFIFHKMNNLSYQWHHADTDTGATMMSTCPLRKSPFYSVTSQQSRSKPWVTKFTNEQALGSHLLPSSRIHVCWLL